jgi:FkbM family methyltransferase
MNYSNIDSKGEYLDSKLNKLINKDNGFYIELGANDGLIQSNTALLEFNRGWKGLLIEPSYDKFMECVRNRPNSICYQYACVSNDYKDSMICGDFTGGMMASINGKRTQSTTIVEVHAISLETILDQYPPNNIDFLSIDTEGYELNVLQGLNLNKYRPNYILIEIYNDQYDSIISYLLNHNYTLHSNFTNYNYVDNPNWDGTHNDYLFVNNQL